MQLVEVKSMTDICKCKAANCPLKETCYRWLAADGKYQAYFIVDKPSENCREYWKVTSPEEVERLNRVWRD